MVYPVQITDCGYGFSLFLPVQEQIRPTYEIRVSENAQGPFPFWAKVWPSCLALTKYLAENIEKVRGKKVLEIGAGTGLPSFAIASSADSVIISDHSMDAVELMEKNIALLGLANVTAQCLDWNHFPEDVTADIILLSDINYAPEQFVPLSNLIQRFLAEGSTIILATPQRITSTVFAEGITAFIADTLLLTVETPDQPVAISIMTLSC